MRQKKNSTENDLEVKIFLLWCNCFCYCFVWAGVAGRVTWQEAIMASRQMKAERRLAAWGPWRDGERFGRAGWVRGGAFFWPFFWWHFYCERKSGEERERRNVNIESMLPFSTLSYDGPVCLAVLSSALYTGNSQTSIPIFFFFFFKVTSFYSLADTKPRDNTQLCRPKTLLGKVEGSLWTQKLKVEGIFKIRGVKWALCSVTTGFYWEKGRVVWWKVIYRSTDKAETCIMFILMQLHRVGSGVSAETEPA